MICELCGTSSKSKNIKYETTYFGNSKIFEKINIECCDKCGLGIAHPIPKKNDLDNFYANEYRAVGSPFHIDFKITIGQLKTDLRSISQIILALHFKKINQGDVFADLGPGGGDSFASMTDIFGKNYVNCWAIEYSAGAAAYYKQKFNVESHFDLSQMCSEKSKKVDLLLSSHSLEHFSFVEGLSFLNSLHDCMSASGVAVFEVPHVDLRMHADVRGGDDPHLLFFSKQSLVLLFEKCGYDVLFAETCGTHFEKIIANGGSQKNNALKSILKRSVRRLLNSFPRLGNLIVKIFGEKGINFRDPNFAYGGNRDCLRIVVRPIGQPERLE